MNTWQTADWENAYEDLTDLLNVPDAPGHASELHGMMVGMLAGSEVSTLQVRELVQDYLASALPEAAALTELYDVVEQLLWQTREGLTSTDLGFRPLMPTDDSPLPRRLEALGQWTRGFLEGLAIGGSGRLAALGDEQRDMLKDFVEISRISTDVEAGAASDEVEHQWLDVLEYVRIGVMSCYFELRGAPAASSRLH